MNQNQENKRLNVLLVSKYDIEQGGVAGVLQSLKSYLVSKGHRVIMLTHDKSKGISDLNQQLLRTDPAEPSPLIKVDFGLAKFWPNLFYKKQFKKIVSHFKVDVIHSHGLSRSEIAYRMSQASKVPLIVTSHGDLNHKHIDTFKRKFKIRKILSHANYVTHLTQPMATKADIILNTNSKSKIIHNGIDLNDWPSTETKKKNYVISVGRFVNQKGFHILLKAYAEACQHNHFQQGLVLLGDGPEKNQLIALAKRLKLDMETSMPKEAAKAQTLYLPGYLSGTDKVQALSEATLFLFTSQTDEAFSLVLLEAMAAGLPILASDFAMARYLVTCGMNATLIPHNSAQMWRKQLVEFDPELARIASDANQKAVIQFDLNRVHQQYLDVYQKIAN